MAKDDPRQSPDVELFSHSGDSRELLKRPLELESESAPALPSSRDPRAALDFRTIFELEVGYVMRTLRRLGVRGGTRKTRPTLRG